MRVRGELSATSRSFAVVTTWFSEVRPALGESARLYHQTPGEESRVFEPQGTGFFLLLLVVFGGLLVWVALARQLVFRVFAGCLAFLPAMVFGVAAVNKFYDYYQTWGGMINDLTGQGVSSIPKYAAPGPPPTSSSTRTSAGSPASPKTPRSATCSRRRSPGPTAT